MCFLSVVTGESGLLSSCRWELGVHLELQWETQGLLLIWQSSNWSSYQGAAGIVFPSRCSLRFRVISEAWQEPWGSCRVAWGAQGSSESLHVTGLNLELRQEPGFILTCSANSGFISSCAEISVFLFLSCHRVSGRL